MAEPSPGDLARRLEDWRGDAKADFQELKRDIRELTGEIKALPYVNIDTYNARHEALRDVVAQQGRTIEEMKADRKAEQLENARFRRQMLTIVVTLVLIPMFLVLAGISFGGVVPGGN